MIILVYSPNYSVTISYFDGIMCTNWRRDQKEKRAARLTALERIELEKQLDYSHSRGPGKWNQVHSHGRAGSSGHVHCWFPRENHLLKWYLVRSFAASEEWEQRQFLDESVKDEDRTELEAIWKEIIMDKRVVTHDSASSHPGKIGMLIEEIHGS